MTSATTIIGAVNDWLASFGAVRKAALERGGKRFAALLEPLSGWNALHTDVDEHQHVGVTLTITSGLHRGASMALQSGEYLVGSGEDCDIVLRDSGVQPHHCRLQREWFGFSVQDLRGEQAAPVAPREVNYRGGEIEALYAVGDITLTLRQPPPAPDATAPVQPAARWRNNRLLGAALVVGLILGTAVVFVTVERRGKHADVQTAERAGAGKHALPSDLLEQAHHALAAENLQLSLQSDRLRIEGTTTEASVKDRIRALTGDLRGTVAVEDRVTYIDPRDRPPPTPPLPVRLRGVMVGNPSYFLTDRGVRYFVGGVLPDGAEVLAIEERQLRFRRADKVVVYNLE